MPAFATNGAKASLSFVVSSYGAKRNDSIYVRETSGGQTRDVTRSQVGGLRVQLYRSSK